MATIDGWLSEMTDAADQGDTTTFAKLARRIADKVDREPWNGTPKTPGRRSS